MKHLSIQFSPTFFHFLPLRHKYSPRLPVFKHPQSTARDQVSYPYKAIRKMIIVSFSFYGLDDREFDSRHGLGIFLFTTASRPALGPTQPPIQRVLGVLSFGVRRPERETDHSPPPNAEIKNARSYTFTPPTRLHSVMLS
jgi:hypothetical protein